MKVRNVETNLTPARRASTPQTPVSPKAISPTPVTNTLDSLGLGANMSLEAAGAGAGAPGLLHPKKTGESTKKRSGADEIYPHRVILTSEWVSTSDTDDSLSRSSRYPPFATQLGCGSLASSQRSSPLFALPGVSPPSQRHRGPLGLIQHLPRALDRNEEPASRLEA